MTVAELIAELQRQDQWKEVTLVLYGIDADLGHGIATDVKNDGAKVAIHALG